MVESTHFSRLFSPATLSNVKLKNRIMMLPMGTAFASVNGEVTDRTIAYFVERAKGGAALIMPGNLSVDGKIALNQLVLDSDWFLEGHYRLVEAIHACGARAAAQLNHPGRQRYPVSLEGQQPVSSSPLRTRYFTGELYPVARALEEAEIYAIMDKFAATVIRAKKAGYDLVELHGAHGYLINQFISPYMNKRTDKFGGSLENRMRFPLELLKRIKETVGAEYPIGMRISAEEFVEGGVTVKDSPAIAQMLAGAGLAYISVSAGIYETMAQAYDTMAKEEGWKTYLWKAIKEAVNIPIVAGGGLKTPLFCERLLASGVADFIGLARPLLADPEWPNKARGGRVEDIRMCISCFECATPSAGGRLGARRCTVNAAMGRETEFCAIKPAEVKKRVMVVGGGPGGMEAARVAALRGNEVTLYEKASQLGGALHVAAAPPNKEKLLWVLDYLKTQIEKLGVKVELDTPVTPALVEKVKPDAIILAVGAEPIVPNIPSVDRSNVVTALDVQNGKSEIPGKHVAVIGGSMAGCETADYLATKGKTVTIVKMRPGEGADDMQPHNRVALLERLRAARIPVLSNKEVIKITDEGVLIRDRATGKNDMVKADWIVLALGARPLRDLAEALEGKGVDIYLIGDCREPGIIKEAVYEGSVVGRQV